MYFRKDYFFKFEFVQVIFRYIKFARKKNKTLKENPRGQELNPAFWQKFVCIICVNTNVP